MTPARRGDIDWLRGVAVLVMIEAHTFDAWTAVAERTRPAYAWVVILAGCAAPMFLFLAGLSLALAASRRVRTGADAWATAWQGVRRGGFILLLALLFRVQSFILSGGTQPLAGLLKVDILNVMGVASAGVALLWWLGRTPALRMAVLLLAAAGVAMATPLVRLTPLLDIVPDPFEAYIRPLGNRGTFSLFPWAGFVAAGGAAGVFMDRVSGAGARERAAYGWLGGAGLLIALAGHGASLLPTIYPQSHFWTTSPTFFVIRVGGLLALVWGARAWDRRTRFRRLDGREGPVGRALQAFGRSSLLVYWVHVELAYGVLAHPIKRLFTLEQMVPVYVLFVLLMYGLVLLKQRWTTRQNVPVTG